MYLNITPFFLSHQKKNNQKNKTKPDNEKIDDDPTKFAGSSPYLFLGNNVHEKKSMRFRQNLFNLKTSDTPFLPLTILSVDIGKLQPPSWHI